MFCFVLFCIISSSPKSRRKRNQGYKSALEIKCFREEAEDWSFTGLLLPAPYSWQAEEERSKVLQDFLAEAVGPQGGLMGAGCVTAPEVPYGQG